MKNQIQKLHVDIAPSSAITSTIIAIYLLMLASAFISSGCTENTDITELNKTSTTKRAAIPQSSFGLWQTCNTKPYYISGTNGIAVLVGGNECTSNYLAAQQKTGQTANGMQFYGAFKGGSNAPDGTNEIAAFIADDVNTWHGREMGFVKTLNDNALKAYLQGTNVPTVFGLISVNDNGYHTYKCQVSYTDHRNVDFYVDGVYKLTLQNSNIDYWNHWNYMVGTTHKTSIWNSTGQQLEMYDMTTY
jgi:hypothetical protein